MSERVTSKRLGYLLNTLAGLMGWNVTEPRISFTTTSVTECKAGYTFLSHETFYGWTLCQYSTPTGGEKALRERCSAREMQAWLEGAIAGAEMEPTPPQAAR